MSKDDLDAWRARLACDAWTEALRCSEADEWVHAGRWLARGEMLANEIRASQLAQKADALSERISAHVVAAAEKRTGEAPRWEHAELRTEIAAFAASVKR